VQKKSWKGWGRRPLDAQTLKADYDLYSEKGALPENDYCGEKKPKSEGSKLYRSKGKALIMSMEVEIRMNKLLPYNKKV